MAGRSDRAKPRTAAKVPGTGKPLRSARVAKAPRSTRGRRLKRNASAAPSDRYAVQLEVSSAVGPTPLRCCLTYRALSCRPAVGGGAKRLRFGARGYRRSIGRRGSRSAAAPCWAAARQGRRGHWVGRGRAETEDVRVATAGAVRTVSPALGSGQSWRESNAHLARRAQARQSAQAFESEKGAAETPAGSSSLGSGRAQQATRKRGSEVRPNVPGAQLPARRRGWSEVPEVPCQKIPKVDWKQR